MSHPSTLYRFRIELTDVDRNQYRKLDFRTAMNPSESEAFLVTRVLAYALNIDDDLQFSKEGLGNPDDPCISIVDPDGGYKLWIEIGNPSAKKIHKATKTSKQVKIYTYKNPEILIQELRAGNIYQPERIDIFSFSTQFLNPLEELVKKDNYWNLIHNEGTLMIQIEDEAIEGEVMQHSLVKA